MLLWCGRTANYHYFRASTPSKRWRTRWMHLWPMPRASSGWSVLPENMTLMTFTPLYVTTADSVHIDVTRLLLILVRWPLVERLAIGGFRFSYSCQGHDIPPQSPVPLLRPLCTPSGCLTGQWPFLCILYRLHSRQRDLSPSELIKINVCACACIQRKRKSDSGELITGEEE